MIKTMGIEEGNDENYIIYNIEEGKRRRHKYARS